LQGDLAARAVQPARLATPQVAAFTVGVHVAPTASTLTLYSAFRPQDWQDVQTVQVVQTGYAHARSPRRRAPVGFLLPRGSAFCSLHWKVG
jgi:hypothetical protein